MQGSVPDAVSRLAILIVSWNTRALLQACLSAVYAHPPGEAFDVIVVDNDSADDSAEMVQRCFPQVRLIESRENLGFARANNLAAAGSNSDYVLLLNPDTEVTSGALQALVDFMDSHSTAGAVGAQLLNSDGSRQFSAYRRPTLKRELWYLLHLDWLYPYATYRQQEWDALQVRQVDVLKGACLLVRRQALGAQALFDESYFMYTEEVDLCRRIQDMGWHLYWLPQARVVHHEGQSTRQAATSMFIQLYRSKLIYFRKHGGVAAAAAYKLILLLAACVRLLLLPLGLLLKPARRRSYRVLAQRYARLIMAIPGL